jgi:hypothetical protein
VHTHFSALSALNTFLAVLLVGTVFRLAALHLQCSANSSLSHLGAAMTFQY